MMMAEYIPSADYVATPQLYFIVHVFETPVCGQRIYGLVNMFHMVPFDTVSYAPVCSFVILFHSFPKTCVINQVR